MKDILKKYWFIFVLIFIILIVCLIFLFNKREFSDNDIKLEYLVGNEEVIVSNSLPMTDMVGKTISVDNYKAGSISYVEFEVSSNVDEKIEYEVFLTKNNVDLEVPVKFVKVYLTDDNNTELKYFDESRVPTYYDLRLADTNASGRLIYSGSLKKKGSQKFVLRMWVADTYELTAEDVTFSANINVKVK